MTGPAVSILMPSFNSARFVLEAVDGAVEQMRDGDELLIQDGGSTDGTIEQLHAAYAGNPHVQLVVEPDGGQADALNRALARAVNPVIGWLNCDDRLYPGALDAVRRPWIQRPELEVVYGSWTIFDEDGVTQRVNTPREWTLSSLTRRPHVFTGAIFYRAETLREVGGFDPELNFCMDLDLVLRLAARHVSTAQVPEVLGGFRWHEDSKTGAVDFGVVREAFLVRRRNASAVAGRAEAYVWSGVHVFAHWATPIRRSRLYSRLRLMRQRAGGAPVLDGGRGQPS